MPLDPRKELRTFVDQKRAATMQRYFKTGPGQYGEGDIFLGVSVADIRKIAKKYTQISTREVRNLLYSKIHEDRMLALLILVIKSRKAPAETTKFYLRHIAQVNNWDLVDLSAPKILGEYLLDKDR